MLTGLRRELPMMTELLSELVCAESPSHDPAATDACGRVLDRYGSTLLGQPAEWITRQDRNHLRWAFGDRTRVLLVGHLDTVWPVGTLDRWPFRTEDGRATGPGCFDMKAGLVQGLFALSRLRSLEGVTFLVTADEELGSPTSRQLVEETVRGAGAALVLEPSSGGALKTARKGILRYRIHVTGRAAHAGLEPEKGVNAGLELARQLVRIHELARPRIGTTVTPTVLSAGTTPNTVPATAHADIDVRVSSTEEQDRVVAEMRNLQPSLRGARVQAAGGPNRPPFTTDSSSALFVRAELVAERLDLPPLTGASVGGGSDGNFTAALGVPTLDGLGAVGDGAHAEGEHVRLDAMPERAALVAGLVGDLLTRPVQSDSGHARRDPEAQAQV